VRDATLTDLRFLDCGATEVAGAACNGMTVRSGTGVLGQLEGFIVDPIARRLQYLVVKTSGWLGLTRLMPLESARIDVDGHTIELLDDDTVDRSEPFRPERFPAFSDTDLIAAIFGTRATA